ncbi:MAG: hypothetical protein EA347_10955 [Thioalkalivibrio sp.]|nr:MAG: hypothetical protein EA347_10955 [Thioalkalivibrio sp.]
MNKALYLPAVLFGLAAGPLFGAGPEPGVTGGLSSAYPGSEGPGSELPAISRRDPLQEVSVAPREASGRTRLGTQRLAYQSLIHRDRDRPGAVAEWQPARETDIRGFVFHPRMEGQSGNAPQESDLEHQLFGLVAAHAVPAGSRGTLNLTSGWVAGNELADTAGDGTEAPARQAWSLGADASVLDSRLRVSFEEAGSGQARGMGGGLGGRRGTARRLVAEWKPDTSDGLHWHAGAEYRWVGPEFDSAANTGVTTDRERMRAEGGLEVDDWQIGVLAQRERDDVIRERPGSAERKDRYRLRTTWTPPEIGSGWWRGRPRVRMDTEFGQNERLRAPESGSAMAAYRRLQLESEFRTEAGRWGIKATRGQVPGAIDSGQAAGIDTSQLELYRDQRGFKAFPVRAQLEWRQREDRVTGTTQDRWEASFGSRTLDLHHRVDADFDLRYRHQLRSDTGLGEADMQLGGRVAWILDRPTTNRRGLALTLDAEFRDRSAASGSKDDGYRVLLTLSRHNPLAEW